MPKRIKTGVKKQFLLQAIVVGTIIVSICTGCSKTNGGAVTGAQESRGPVRDEKTIWYSWKDGSLQQVTSPVSLSSDDWKVWTDQIRGIRIIFLKGDAHLAVNTLGVATLHDVFSSELPLSITEDYNRRLFSDRTIGTFFAHGKRLYIHLYYNTVLHPPIQPDQPLALVSFQPKNGEMRVLPFSFQDEHPDWELVSLIPYQESDLWQLAWKRTGDEKTEFRYTELDVEQWKEREIEEEEFLDLLRPLGELKAPVEVQRLIRMYDGNAKKRVFDVKLSHFDQARREVFRFGNFKHVEEGKSELLSLSCFRYQNTYFLLTPDDTVLWLHTSGEKGKYSLPSLPEPFVYTDFITTGKVFLALWEEQDFTEVGKAGILYSVVDE